MSERSTYVKESIKGFKVYEIGPADLRVWMRHLESLSTDDNTPTDIKARVMEENSFLAFYGVTLTELRLMTRADGDAPFDKLTHSEIKILVLDCQEVNADFFEDRARVTGLKLPGGRLKETDTVLSAQSLPLSSTDTATPGATH